MPVGFGPITGLKTGHAQDIRARTGCSVFLAENGMVAACRVLGGAVGERELETMRAGHIAGRIHALVLAGGSAFALVVTARLADDQLWAQALNLGAYDVLAKPFDEQEVIRTLSLAWIHWAHSRSGRTNGVARRA